MQHTLIAVFDNRTDAQNALNELWSSGFSRDAARLSNADPTGHTDSVTGRSEQDSARDATDTGIGASIKNFFTDLFGSDDALTASRYEGAVTRGHHVLTLVADSLPEVERAADIVERYGPTDIDEHASGSDEMPSGAGAMRMGTGNAMGSAPMSAQSASTPSLENAGDRKLFQQQSLNQAEPMGTTYQEPMGKSGLTATGGTSLQGSTLQENSVQGSSLEGTQHSGVGLGSSALQGGTLRGPTQQSGAFQGGSLQGSSLEGSSQRAGMESSPREDSQQRDSSGSTGAAMSGQRPVGGVREIQRNRVRIYSRGVDGMDATGAQQATGGAMGSDMDDDAYFRNHFTSTYGSSGDAYEDYAPAYRYGSQMRGDSRYRDRPWGEVESELRNDWETRHASTGSTWEKMKAAVRHGWERMSGGDNDDDYRSHYSSNYAGSGKTYDEYAPAYSYGSEMARSEIYRNRPWDEAMPSLRNDWESRSGGSTWEHMKDAVRRGWDRMTQDDDDSYYRSHWNATYSTSGETYDDYRPAYSYGSQMRNDSRYSGRQWDDAENDLRSDWESRNAGGPSTWEKMKSAVRHGWDRMTS